MLPARTSSELPSTTEKGLQDVHLNAEFFGKVVGSRGTLLDWKLMEIDSGGINLTKFLKQGAKHISKKFGIIGYIIRYTSYSGSVVEWPVVMKSKLLDNTVLAVMTNGPSLEGSGLETAARPEFQTLLSVIGYRLTHERELAIYQMEEPELQQFLPQTYHSISSISKEIFVVVMEYLSNEHFIHLNTIDDVSVWTTADIKIVLRDLAKIHAIFVGKVEWLGQQSWMDHTHSRDAALKLRPFLKHLLANIANEFPEFWTSQVVKLITEAIDSVDELWNVFDSFPKTLIHNDCNPRNICIRKVTSYQDASSYEDLRQMCIYDWEMARIGVPQHDLAEFLAFVLPPEYSIGKRMELIAYYIEMLEKYSKQKFDQENFLKVLDAAALDMQFTKFSVYTAPSKANQVMFVSRVVRSNSTYLLQRKSDGHIKFTTTTAEL